MIESRSKMALWYAVLAAVWIVASDLLVTELVPDSSSPIHTYKGLGFVAATTLLLWVLLRRWQARLASAESALGEVRRMFKTVYERLDDAVLIVGKDRLIVDCNAAVERVLGYTPDELKGKTTRILHVDDDAFRNFDELGREPLATHGVFRGEFQLRHKSGRTLPTEHTVAIIPGDEGVVVSIVRDVSEQHETAEVISRQRAHLESMLANVTDIVAVVDTAAKIQFANQAIERVLGYPRDDMLGESVLEYVHPDDQPKLAHALRAATIHPGSIQTVTYRARHEDGHWVELETTGTCPIGGAVDGVVVSIRDITQQRAAERVLREKETELRQAQKMEAVGRLAGGIAHDFNNVLTVISAHCTFLETELQDSEEARGDLQAVVDAAKQAAKLTSQLLMFSRHQVVELRSVDIRAEIANLGKMLRRLVGEDVTVDVQLDDVVPIVRADAGQLGQVVMNLAVNARDAMPQGGTLTIEVMETSVSYDESERHQCTPGRYACIRVTDTGVGMDEDTVTRIFDPFFTTKEPGKGTGLGLSTSYGIVTQAGGWIDVDSKVGKGTTFHIYLPAEHAPSRPRGASARVAAVRAHRGARILVVEDDRAVRAALVRLLTRATYQVIEASRPLEALELLQREQIDLLVTDVVMPEMNGRELANRVAASGACDRVLYISGYTPDELLRRDVSEEDALLLRKPFTERQLLNLVSAALDTPAAHREGTG